MMLKSTEYCKELFDSPFFLISNIISLKLMYGLPFLAGTYCSMFFCKEAVLGLVPLLAVPVDCFMDFPKKKKLG